MASLLPAIPTDWRSTGPSYEVIRCRRGTNVFTNADGKDSSRWGADKREYGGVGGEVDHVIRQGGVTSRSHRHYGSGIFNCSAQMQPYQITDLLLSDSRPCDQRLPPPLLTNKINHHRQLCQYPGNHTYTSHRSKFAVFPLADQSLSSKLSPLTRGTKDALQEICHSQFCTTTYTQTYTNPWSSRPTTTTTADELPSTLTSKAETKSQVTDEKDKKEEEGFEEDCEVESKRTNTKNEPKVGGGKDNVKSKLCLENDSKQRQAIVTRENDSDNSNESKPSGVVKAIEKEIQNDREMQADHDRGREAAAEKKRVRWQDQEGDEESSKCEIKEEEEETESEGERETESEDKQLTAEKEVDEEREKQKGSVATSLPQLPNHFRRVSSKYSRNQLSPIWPCSIPYYLSRPHSMLQSLAHRPPTFSGSAKDMRPVDIPTMVVEKCAKEGERRGRKMTAGFADDVISGDVIGESPALLSTALLSGSRIPQTLGVRFKAQAHSRYHQIYPDKIPDLRDSRVESKKYFFFGFHSSVLR